MKVCKYLTVKADKNLQLKKIVKNKVLKSKVSLCLSAPVPGPLNLHSSDVSTDSFEVSWDHSASDIVLYRLSWATFTGDDTKEVGTCKIHYINVF